MSEPSARYAVIGDPIAHSKSPAMHLAAYRVLGLPCRYEAVRVLPAQLEAFVREVRMGAWAGCNVTVPHKHSVLAFADEVDPLAALAGAANTLVRRPDGRIAAFNTDVPALAAELRALCPPPGHGLVLGAGGAARAAVLAMMACGVAHISVCSRDPERAMALARELTGATHLVEGDGLLARPTREARVTHIVQATSAGMSGADPGDSVVGAVAWSSLERSTAVVETIYAPPETPFLAAARARGLSCTNGAGMLARQGALAFELWNGVAAPLDAMLAALATTA